MIKLLKSKKGMTLTELVVGMLILTMVTTTVVALMMPMLRSQVQANEFAEYNTLIDSVANQITSDLACAAKPLELAEGETGENTVLIVIDDPNDVVEYTIVDGVLYISRNDSSPIAVLAEGYYKGKAVEFSYKQAEDSEGIVYELTVELKNKNTNSVLASRTYAVKPLVLNQYPHK